MRTGDRFRAIGCGVATCAVSSTLATTVPLWGPFFVACWVGYGIWSRRDDRKAEKLGNTLRATVPKATSG